MEFLRLSRTIDVAALMLHAPNFDRMAALHELAFRAREHREGSHRPGVRSWRRWLASDEATDVLAVHPDGILDRPGAVAVAVSGRAVGIMPGRSRAEAVAARILSRAIDAMLAEEQSDDALRRASLLLRAGVALGDAMIDRAGLPWAPWPQHAGGRILVPDAETLRRLRRAVTFASRDLPFDGDPLKQLFDDGVPENPEQVWRTPLARTDVGLVVTQPFALSSATLVHAWAAAAQSERAGDLHAAVRAFWAEELTELVRLCGWIRRSGPDDVMEVELDDGTVAALLLVTESPSSAPGDSWDASAATQAALAGLRPVAACEERLFVVVATLSFGRPVSIAVPDKVRAERCWILDAEGLQYLLEASRLDPLGLVRAHRWLPPGLGPVGAIELLDVFGAVRYMEDTAEMLPAGADPTEIAIKAARANAARHPAPGWANASTDIDVTRFQYSDDARYYAPALADSHVRVLLQTEAVVCWTGSASPCSSRYTAEAILTQMTAFWVGRLVDVGLLDGANAWTSILVTFDPQAPADEPLVVDAWDSKLVFRFASGFIELLARGDNTADRLLVAALMFSVLGLERDKHAEMVDRAVEIIAPLGPGTFVIWNDPDRYELPPPTPELTRTSTAARLMADVEMAEALRASGQTGLAHGLAAKAWLDAAVEAVFGVLDREVRACTPDLLRELVRLTGVAADEAERASVTHAARHALGALPAGADLRNEHVNEPSRARVALRFLVELAHARSPHGAVRVNEERLQRLRALAETVLGAATASDFAHGGLVDLSVLVPPTGPLKFIGHGRGLDAHDRQWDLILASAPETSLEQNASWWNADRPEPPPDVGQPLELDGEWGDVSDAMRDSVGFGWNDFLRVARVLADDAITVGGTVEKDRAAAVADARVATGLPIDTCDAVIEFLALERPLDYDPRKAPYKPWKTGRDTGYIRRPLLVVGRQGLLWSGPHLLLSMLEIAKRLELRRMNLPGRGTGRALAKLRAAGDLAWERELAALVSEIGLPVSGGDKIGGRPIARGDGSTLGDIDVLVLHAQSRTVWALDAKRLAPATAPMAFPDEAQQLVAEAHKHRPRLRWLERNLDAVAAEFDRPAGALAGWSVRGALVLASPLAGAFIAQSPVELLTWPQLRSLLDFGAGT